MLQKPEYKANGSMLIDSGVKAFDQQCDLITTGNVMSKVLYGTHVRAKTETECNGFSFKPVELQDSNLRVLRESSNLGFRRVALLASQHPYFDTNAGWCYAICHSRDGHAVVHGALFTDLDHKLVARVDRDSLWLQPRGSSRKVLDAVMPYLAHKE